MNYAPIMAAGPAVHLHLVATLAALLLGIVMLVRRKGTLSHRWLGRLWAALMLVAAVSSFWIGEGFGPVHVLAVVILLTVPAAVLAIRHGRVATHRRVMLALFFTGLVLPGLFTLLPHRLLGQLIFGGG